MKKCLNCLKLIETTRPWKLYCNPRCQREYYWRTHTIIETPLRPRHFSNPDFDPGFPQDQS